MQQIYSLTSIGRPVDMRYPSNRYMVFLLVPAVLLAIAESVWSGRSFGETVLFSLAMAVAAFGAWAMGRELAPDDPSAAFASMALAVVVMLLLGPAANAYGLLVLLTTLGLVRQVNRTTGLTAKMSDSIILFLLSLAVMYFRDSPVFGLVAALSFALDGYLVKPLRRQLVFALFAVIAFVIYLVDHDLSSGFFHLPQTLAQWTTAVIVVIFALNLLTVKTVSSKTDVGMRLLQSSRVRGGMLVALVAVAQGLSIIRSVGLLAAVLAGVCLTSAFRRSFTSPG